MKSTYGEWTYELLLDCPYCETPIDEYSHSELDPKERFKGKIKCKNCGKTFYATVDPV